MAAQDVSQVLQSLANPERVPVIGQLEDMFDAMGMMRSSMSPVWRALFGFGVGSALTWAVRPALMFDDKGAPRPWNYSRNVPGYSTPVPWWLPGTSLAIFFSVFV